MRASEFFDRLGDETKQPTPPFAKGSVSEWRKKLSALGLSGQQIQKLYDHIVDKHAWHPVWAEISEAIGELCLRRESKRPVRHWIVFDWYGRRIAKPIQDPGAAQPPLNAQNAHLAIDEDFQDNASKPSAIEAKQCFVRGFNESGANPEHLVRMFSQAVKPQDKRREQMSEVSE
jgi:hypothetical protein